MLVALKYYTNIPNIRMYLNRILYYSDPILYQITSDQSNGNSIFKHNYVYSYRSIKVWTSGLPAMSAHIIL